jgi:hypothetical protein
MHCVAWERFVNEKLIVKIALKYSHLEIDAASIEELIVEHQSDFQPLLARIIDVDDGRVELVDDSLEIESIEFDEDGRSGVAEVEFMSSFYAGCKDLNSTDWHPTLLPFRIENDVLVFEIDLPVRWRVDN